MAAAAVSSSFSTSMQSLQCIRYKNFCNHSDHIRITTARGITQVLSISHSPFIEKFVITATSKCCRQQSLTVAVAQEHAEAETEEVMLTAEAETETEDSQAEAEKVEEVEQALSGGDESEESEDSPVNTKLYFGNLPYLCDSAQLAAIIQDYGSPELVEVLYNRDTGRSRGFAFVTMSTVEDCNAVIENLDGSEYGGRTLRVNFADKPKPKEALYPETEHKLFVGNLSWTVTSEILTRAFQEYGNVVGARVLYDGETGRSRGYGFVCFPSKSEMETALQSLDGVELEGRPIRVSLAQGKRQ